MNRSIDQKARMKAIMEELQSLGEDARRIPIGRDAREPLAAVMAAVKILLREAEQIAGTEIPNAPDDPFHVAQALLDNWDELTPIWDALAELEDRLRTVPRKPESIPLLLESTRTLRAVMEAKRSLLPAAYYEATAPGLDRLIKAAESGRLADANSNDGSTL